MVSFSAKELNTIGKLNASTSNRSFNKFSDEIVNNSVEKGTQKREKSITSSPSLAFYEKGKALFALQPQWKQGIESDV